MNHALTRKQRISVRQWLRKEAGWFGRVSLISVVLGLLWMLMAAVLLPPLIRYSTHKALEYAHEYSTWRHRNTAASCVCPNDPKTSDAPSLAPPNQTANAD